MHRVLTSLFLLATALPVFSQDWSASSNALLTFSLQSSAEILDRLDTYELSTEREKGLYNRYQDTLNVRFTRLLVEPLYAALANADIALQPKGELAEYLTYGNDGLPSVLLPKRAIKRLVNKGHTGDYYFVAKISIGAKGIMAGAAERVKPQVRCQIKVFDATGETVRNVEAEVEATQFIKATEFPRLTFDKIGLDYIEMLQQRLEPLVLQAITEAVGSL